MRMDFGHALGKDHNISWLSVSTVGSPQGLTENILHQNYPVGPNKPLV